MAGGRRGSAQVEAAMIMPLVILAVLSVIWLLTVFYSQTALRSGVHMALRSAAGISSDTVLRQGASGFTGLYDSLLSGERIGELLETEGAELICGAGPLKRGLTLESEYNGLAVPAVMRLHFGRSYGRRGLFSGKLEADHTCWYFAIDEAQWVRNEDWLREELKWGTEKE